MLEESLFIQHLPFCKALNLTDDEISMIRDVIEEIHDHGIQEEITLEEIKGMMASRDQPDKIALATYSILKSCNGDRLLYLLVGAFAPQRAKSPGSASGAPFHDV